jgi:predicted dehydrogenase
MEQASRGGGDRVRLALIGLGWWGGELAKAIRRAGNGQVVRCFARSEESRKAFAEEHGCATAESHEAILDDPEVDGIAIATPHSTHLPMIRAAAEAGKHVFVEKPLTLSVAEAREAIDIAERWGIILQVGHNRRRASATRAVKALVDAGINAFDVASPGEFKAERAVSKTALREALRVLP